jgi:hypothetical protein
MAWIKYRSIYEAANCAGIAPTWVNQCLIKSGGGPVVIRGQFIVTEFWCKQRIEGLKHERN